MDPSKENLALVGLAALTLILAGLFLYGWVCARIVKYGGTVPVKKFGIPDLIVAWIFITLFLFRIAAGFKSASVQIHDSDLLDGAITYLIIVGFLASFMFFRGINLVDQLGLRKVRLDKTAGYAFLFLIGVYPLMICAGIIAKIYLGPDAEPQELVKYFVDASQQMNYRALFLTFFTGVVIAPIAEEFLFRGYIYVALKRYLGITAGVVLNAALFAAVHLNAASLLPLFVFAICLTLVYEFKGSILINMCMHSLFNFTSFYLMLSIPSSHLQ